MAPTRPQVGELNRYIFYLSQDWNGLRGAIIRIGFERMSGGQNVGTIRVTPWAIIYVRPGALGQILHRFKSLSYVNEYVYQIC